MGRLYQTSIHFLQGVVDRVDHERQVVVDHAEIADQRHDEGANEEITINKEVAKSYIEALRSVKDEFDLVDDLSLSVVAKFPDVFTVVKAQTDEDALWADVESVAKKAAAAFVEMRRTEGEKMKADLLEKLSNLEAIIEKIKERLPAVTEAYRERLTAKIKESLSTFN